MSASMSFDIMIDFFIGLGGVVLGVSMSCFVNYLFNHGNKHDSYNKWRRERLCIKVISLRDSIKKISLEIALSTSQIECHSDDDIKQKIHTQYAYVLDDISEISILLRKNQRDKLYAYFIFYVESQVAFKLSLKNPNFNLSPFIERSQRFNGLVSDIINNMK
ncbi:hypothetical protein [Klebsiella pneumoniae]|uniref:hypothetical protein n=1 Tax=Klebsiella pneumoniae TaxID=573 RepID=UPI00195BC679|nr:hypothetical protein [Klebsiella pneumoniae]QRS08267.1 hypothetical protein I6K43_02655 [Klebsiella pneumoniae]